MMRCTRCNKTYSDEIFYCLSDGTPLVSDATEEFTVIRPSPIVQPSARQGVNPLFAYVAIGLLALVAGGAIVAWLKSDSTVSTNASNSTKMDTPITVANTTQEKPIETRKQPETTRLPKTIIPPSAKVEPTPYNSVPPQTYRVAGVAYNDVLFVRYKPGQLNQYVGKIPPNATGIQVYGNGVRVGKNIWVSVNYEGISGWVNSKYLAPQ